MTSSIASDIALNAIRSYANRNADRDCLVEGQNYPGVKLKVTGTVAGHKVAIAINGRLSVGQSNPSGSTRRPTHETLVSLCLEYMPKTKAAKLLADIRSGNLPEGENRDEAAQIVRLLSIKSPRAGSVSFVEE